MKFVIAFNNEIFFRNNSCYLVIYTINYDQFKNCTR